MLSVLILEDDLTFSLMLTTWLRKKGFEVTAISTISEAKRKIQDNRYDLFLSDLRLPDGSGMDLLPWVKKERTSLPVIMMTSYADIPTAVQAMKSGAADYITKPLNPENLLEKINGLLNDEVPSPDKNAPDKKQEAGKSLENPYLEGNSPAAKQLYQHVRLVAPTDMSVLITGASGTGKEFVARRIHEQSNRASFPFIALDCGALSKELAASEFFGHVKGSFTGAVTDKKGAFVAAEGGTVFLDEIGNLSYEVQVQLLRALQERKIKPIGSNQEININVRLISATNENLRKAIEKGDFREDLYHRIKEFTIRIPDLKDRKEDILLFAHHFLDMANKELKKNIIGFDKDTLHLIRTYSWPGNLREMKNAIRYATLLTSERYITLADFPTEITEVKENTSFSTAPLKNKENEKLLIENALKEADNNKTRAAQLLGIDRKTLYNKMKLHGLN